MFRKVGYKQIIPDTDWVSEIIIERFDASFELLSNNSVIYGGAVRDALAGMPLEGDLDISIPANDFNAVHQMFNVSTRWLAVGSDNMIAKPQSSYDKKRPMPVIRSVIEFEGVNGARAQLICSNSRGSTKKEAALYVPRNVDIICCGVVIDRNGTVYEVVEGAYEDCQKGILRLNTSMENPSVESLKDRVAKLEARGWTNEVDMREAAKLERRKKPKDPRLKKTKPKKKKASVKGFISERNACKEVTFDWPEATETVVDRDKSFRDRAGKLRWKEATKKYDSSIDEMRQQYIKEKKRSELEALKRRHPKWR